MSNASHPYWRMIQREIYWKHVYCWEANIVLTPKREHDSIGISLTFPGRDRYSFLFWDISLPSYQKE